jgi:ketosteroid isomerase-like protein
MEGAGGSGDDIADVVVDVSEYVAEGDRVAVRMKVSVRVNGQIVDVPIADFFTVRDGRIVSDDGYFDVHGRPCS